MLRSLDCVAIAMIALLSVGDSHAAEEDTDCAAAYDGMLKKIEREKSALSEERQLARQMLALRIYRACQTGHLAEPSALFERLDRTRF